MPRASTPAQAPLPPLEASLFRLTVDDLKWYAAALGANPLPARKGELTELLRRALTERAELKKLVDQLTLQQRLVVAEVVHNLGGLFQADRIAAKYSGSPAPKASRSFVYFSSFGQKKQSATPYDLLFAHDYDVGTFIPGDLAKSLRELLPAPPPDQLGSQAGPPRLTKPPKGQARPPEVFVSDAERAVFHDLSATLYLVQQGKASVSPATRLPTLPTLRQLRSTLLLGDYLSDDYERAEDAVRPLALIVLVQAAKWAAPTTAGNKLELTKAGQALIGATLSPQHIRDAWERWLKSDLLDELSRVRNIKGQQAKGTRLTKPAERRAKLAAALREFPAGRWVATDELLRHLRATDLLPAIERGTLSLGVGAYNNYYDGSESYGGGAKYWDVIVGSYLRATLWEYVATLGLVEIAYTRPELSPHKFGDLYYLDGDYLSRYDGLLAMRLTNLGAFVLGLASDYSAPEPLAAAGAPALAVLPNLDLVITEPANITPGDRALIERVAAPQSEGVYHLSRDLLIEAAGSGLEPPQVLQFLASKSGQPAEALPQIVRVFFEDLAKRLGALREAGRQVLIESDDPFLLTELANSPGLRGLARLATIDDRPVLLIPEDQEAAARRQLKKLGYLPKKGAG